MLYIVDEIPKSKTSQAFDLGSKPSQNITNCYFRFY